MSKRKLLRFVLADASQQCVNSMLTKQTCFSRASQQCLKASGHDMSKPGQKQKQTPITSITLHLSYLTAHLSVLIATKPNT
jgi:hypothetical protein